MIEWGLLKTYVQEAVLKDSKGTKFSAEQLQVWARWAIHELSFHTAEQAQVIYECDGLLYQFSLPDDMVDSIEKVGLVGVDSGKNIDWLPCLRQDPNTCWPWPPAQEVTTSWSNQVGRSRGFWEWPHDTLTISAIPPLDYKVQLNYFKLWDAPVNDADMLTFPAWMEQPFVYMLAARAMDPLAFQASNIRQWNDKTVQGGPEDNPLQRQYNFYIKNAARLLGLHRAQDRENWFSAYRPRS